MTKRLLLAPLVLAVVGGCSGMADHDGNIDSIVEAEHRFAADVAESGMKAGFLAHLDETSVVFRPSPTDARTWYESSEDAPGLLTWEPTMADVSAAGDIGFTTGPWEFRPEGAGTEPTGFGHYVSVWIRGSGGVWQVAIDAGVPHDRIRGRTPEIERRGHARVADPYEPPAQFEDLLDAENGLWANARERGFAEALSSVLARDARVYRMGARPARGPRAARELIGAEADVSWEPRGGSIGESGDLAYTYGTSVWSGAGEDGSNLRSAYLRVWERTSEGEWRVVIDLTNPIPGEAPGREE